MAQARRSTHMAAKKKAKAKAAPKKAKKAKKGK